MEKRANKKKREQIRKEESKQEKKRTKKWKKKREQVRKKKASKKKERKRKISCLAEKPTCFWKEITSNFSLKKFTDHS